MPGIAYDTVCVALQYFDALLGFLPRVSCYRLCNAVRAVPEEDNVNSMTAATAVMTGISLYVLFGADMNYS